MSHHDSQITGLPIERLVAEWLAERARLVGSLIGLTDEQFNSETAPGEWTYRVIAKHVLALEQELAQDESLGSSGPGRHPV